MSEESGATQALRMRCLDMSEEANHVAEWISSAIRELAQCDPEEDSAEELERSRKRQHQALEAALLRANGMAGSLTVAAGEGPFKEALE